MKEILDFIESFIENEFQCLLSKYSIDITDDGYQEYQSDVESFFHSSLYPIYDRPMNIVEVISSEKWIKRYERRKSKLLRRKLFSIRKFVDFELGLQLDMVKGKSLYRADLSYHEQTPKEFSGITDAYYITETNEGLKIIYKKHFSLYESGEWVHAHDNKGKQVINEGTQVAIERIEVPIDPASLAEYNK